MNKISLLLLLVIGAVVLLLPAVALADTTISATVTSYSSVHSCSTKSCIMASGKSAYVGAVACPRKYKLGTKVKILGIVYTCEDRTARRFDGRFDIFQGYGKGAHKKAITWGIQVKKVIIIHK